MAVTLVLLILGLWLNGLSCRLRPMPPRRTTIEIYRKRMTDALASRRVYFPPMVPINPQLFEGPRPCSAWS
jgi:hypothetical protein